MGNAVRLQTPLGNPQPVSSARRPGGVRKHLASCTACAIEFHPLFRLKRFCNMCRDPFCTECLIRLPEKPMGYRICSRCQIFSKPNFGWDDLMQLKVRDLVWFVQRQNIPSRGLKEKEQLAERILEYYGSDNYHREQAMRMQQVAEMASGMEDLRVAECSTGRSAVADTTNADTPSPPTPPTADEHQGNESRQSYSSCDELGQNFPQNPAQQLPPSYSDLYGGMRGNTEDEPQASSSSTNPGLNPRITAGTERVPLEEINSIEEVELLSVKQLKDLLAFNLVDYKGCCERHELITRAKRLWRSNRENQEQLQFEESSEDQVEVSKELCVEPTAKSNTDQPITTECRICMDAPIDCVLLECGHMVTCVRCGRQLADCPICRQCVIRCVRIFKS